MDKFSRSIKKKQFTMKKVGITYNIINFYLHIFEPAGAMNLL